MSELDFEEAILPVVKKFTWDTHGIIF
jgi:hypothetical protein